MSIPKNLRTLKTNFEKADGLGIRKNLVLVNQNLIDLISSTKGPNFEVLRAWIISGSESG